ncbi:MAG TPA: MetQ/NlpA family ABC transporter substrate-binding protein [Stackebrandtia sp.]|uniref:MetQ/NlpA family ABC transporter substrate-binding protein n=1 Tax=Stackebrandtia sp. TaxID=2023065 RepID=UPI002D2986D2|nr:MetQ/NlpA family ABC transporter substrate-binding protein [Stackebrandtia sp.]HZE40565.1 MetQ/NlpA family ABC transporter substrate-binding protein [Stackebrandtia sp.]
MNRKALLATTGAAAVLAATTLSACASDDDTLVVGATPEPHAKILEYIQDNLADDAGLKLEVKEFTEYTQVNPATESGDLDANYFQTPQYLKDFNAKNHGDLVSVASVHVEPMAVYSKKVASLDDVPSGAQVSLPNDAANEARALELLDANGIIALSKNAGDLPTEDDITSNPRHLKFNPADAANLPRTLDDSELAIINGNYAVEAGLKPSKALAIEKARHNPYSNDLVVPKKHAKDAQVKKLERLLTSDKVRAYIKSHFKDGSVLPVF